jgi:hypothetical protein
MKNKKYHTVSEQFQNPIVKIVKGSTIIAIFGPRQQDSSMSGSNRRFTIMLQSDVTINYYFWRKVWRYQGGNQKLSNERQWIGQKKKDKRTNNDLQNGVNIN